MGSIICSPTSAETKVRIPLIHGMFNHRGPTASTRLVSKWEWHQMKSHNLFLSRGFLWVKCASLKHSPSRQFSSDCQSTRARESRQIKAHKCLLVPEKPIKERFPQAHLVLRNALLAAVKWFARRPSTQSLRALGVRRNSLHASTALSMSCSFRDPTSTERHQTPTTN